MGKKIVSINYFCSERYVWHFCIKIKTTKPLLDILFGCILYPKCVQQWFWLFFNTEDSHGSTQLIRYKLFCFDWESWSDRNYTTVHYYLLFVQGLHIHVLYLTCLQQEKSDMSTLFYPKLKKPQFLAQNVSWSTNTFGDFECDTYKVILYIF